MAPIKEVSESGRRSALKAWDTRRKQAAKTKAEIADVAEAKESAPEIVETPEAKEAAISPELVCPENWKQIVAEIRNRARNAHGQEQCECHGQCLKHHGRCEEVNHSWPKHRRPKRKVKIRFTTAHLCHTPKCDNKLHLRAMCEPCHLIYDLRCRQLGLCGDLALEWAMRQGKIPN